MACTSEREAVVLSTVPSWVLHASINGTGRRWCWVTTWTVNMEKPGTVDSGLEAPSLDSGPRVRKRWGGGGARALLSLLALLWWGAQGL